MLRRSAALVAVVALSAPAAMAGEFFTGTRSTSDRFETTRTAVGHDSLTAKREFKNEVKGSSHKHFVNVSASAENARLGSRRYGFIEGEAEIDGQLQGTGSLGWGTADLAAFGQLGVEVDGMAGYGHERYLDGSLSASAEWGRADSKYDLMEKGSSVYKMASDFTEITNTDGTNAEAGSVFSFN